MRNAALLALTLALSCSPALRSGKRCPRAADKRAPASQPAQAGPRAPATLIRGATVWTAAGAVLERADVLLRDGRIAAVGRDLDRRGVAVVIDGAGKHVTPGLIDPHSHMGVYPVPALRGDADGNEVATPLSPEVRAEDGLWPQDPAFPRALAAGVTLAHIVPGSTNLVGGQTIVVRTTPARTVQELRFTHAPPGLKLACGENPKRVYGKKGGPSTRMGNAARMRAVLHKAREYRARWRAHERKLARFERRCGAQRPDDDDDHGDGDRGDGQPPEPPPRDLALEALVEVLEGKRLAHWHCYRADDMASMLTIAREQGFHVQAFHHATEAYKIRDELKRAKTGAVTWINWWGFKIEAYDAIPEAAALLVAAQVPTAMHSDSPQVIQRLNQEAALAYFKGRAAGIDIDRDRALRLVTIGPAKILGVERWVGSIEPGKLADLVLWDRDPFSVYARAERVFVEGHERYSRAGGARATDFELGVVPSPGPEATPAAPPTPLPASWRPPAPRIATAERNAQAVEPPPVAIVGGTVHRVSAAPLFGATVLIRGGRVAAVGRDLNVPGDARVIDAKGKHVTPGLIAAEATVGLQEISGEPSANDSAPRSHPDPVRAALRAWDGLDPASPVAAVTRVEGFTSAVVRPFGGLLSGQAAAYDLQGSTPAAADLAGPVAMHANLGLDGAGAVGGSRALAMMRLRRLLADARAVQRARAAIDARRYRKLSAPLQQLEALAPVIAGKLPLVVTVRRAADILAVLRLAAEERILVALSGADEGWRVASEIARARVPVLVGPDKNLPATFETLGARFDNAAQLHRAGVNVAFTAEGGAHDVRSLRQMAGIAVAWGLPREAALAGLTLLPARIFGLHERGTLDVGARANVVVWSGDPLELATRAELVLVGGRELPPQTHQSELLQRYR